MNESTEQPQHIPAEFDPEKKAANQLDMLLSDPEYTFLHYTKNMEQIENAASEQEALKIANDLIEKRESATMIVKVYGENGDTTENVESNSYMYKGLRRTLSELKQHAQEIGKGNDAVVVVATTEFVDGTYDVCYKFSKEPETPRGRNSMDVETELQNKFQNIVNDIPENSIGVPEAYYYTQIGNQKFIAMEKLQAKSIDNLRRGFGSMPTWVTERHIDQFIQDLINTIDICHQKGLYHRDMHLGNIMFTQSPTETDKLGYIIDFGLSGHGQEGLDPYRKETNTETFTYKDDYGRINKVKEELLRLWRNQA